MEKVKCIICSESNYKQLYNLKDRFSSENFNLVECICGFIYLNPRPDSFEISRYYSNSSYDPHNQNQSIFAVLYSLIRSLVIRYRYILLKRYSKKKINSVLEVGGGKGDFCRYLGLKNINTICQDPNANFEYSNVTMVDSLDKVETGNKFDSITMWHSLEHIHDIDNLFSNINKLTTSDATLFIAIPNKFAIDRYFFSDRWVAWDAPRHLYHFSYNDLYKLLSNNGWKIYANKTLYHDMVYNTLLSLKNEKYKYIKLIVILLFMLPISVINNHHASSRLYICQKK